jgi:hypothetical protein
MSAAEGPPCDRCGKRVSKARVTRCPFCSRVLCLRCVCPGWGTWPHPLKEHLEDDSGRKQAKDLPR